MKLKILTVCDYNINRSPTVAKFLNENLPHVEARSAGIYTGYPDKNLLSQEHLDWADLVLPMDLNQMKFICDKFKQHPRLHCLGISDVFDPDDNRLIDLLKWYFRTDKLKK